MKEQILDYTIMITYIWFSNKLFSLIKRDHKKNKC